jgi:hypothetical protein
MSNIAELARAQITERIKLNIGLVLMALILGAILGVFILGSVGSASPYEALPGDSVTPAKVSVGGTVTLLRNFNITRTSGALSITRTITRGDCNNGNGCEVVDLSSGSFSMPVGHYENMRREHVLPRTIGPGLWTLKFYSHWEDSLGRGHSAPFPELTLEVVP